jgi:D-alanine-D-alanine ligase
LAAQKPIRRILVITGDHGAPDATKRGGHYNEEDMATHAAMRAAFESLPGLSFDFLTDHARFLDRMRQSPPDLVVNFCDTGFRNVAARELNVPAYLELLEIPYTGAPPAAMVICYDKAIVRLVAEALGVAVPWEAFIPADAPADALPDRYPALIKPNTADGSVGITKDAVVRDRRDASAYLDWLRRTLPGRDALVQEYLSGPEYGIGLIGNPTAGLRALPALEVDYSGLPAGLNPILSYESKALPDSPYWTDIRYKRATLPAAAETALAESAKRLFRRFGLRDYGRFDFRTGADGTIKLMEINPNPAWANDGKLALMAGFAGIAYPDMLRMILEAAVARVGTTA